MGQPGSTAVRVAGNAARRLVAGVLLLVVLSAGVTLTSPAAADPGVPPQAAQRPISYEIRHAGAVYGDRDASFAHWVASTLADRRGWSLAGELRFLPATGGREPDVRIWLAGPTAVDRFGGGCTKSQSCTVGDNVVINDARWRTSVDTWPDLLEYRKYVINHQVGHWLGLPNLGCPAAGAVAPVMVEQSVSLGGCARGTWPTAGEQRAVGKSFGVVPDSVVPDLYALKLHGGTGTELHVIDGATSLSTWHSHHRTLIGNVDPADWDFAVGDYDADGADDVIGIKRVGDSGFTEVHILDGRAGYGQWQLHAVTPLVATNADWTFDVGDYDGDSVLDVWAFDRQLGRVHVVDGISRFTEIQEYAVDMAVAPVADWDVLLGDHDRDGRPDIYRIKRSGVTGHTEVHVITSRGAWRRYAAHAETPLPPTDARWDYVVDDVDGNGYDEVYAIKRRGRTNTTEVHVLADRTYDSFVAHWPTVLPVTEGVPGWRFLLP